MAESRSVTNVDGRTFDIVLGEKYRIIRKPEERYWLSPDAEQKLDSYYTEGEWLKANVVTVSGWDGMHVDGVRNVVIGEPDLYWHFIADELLAPLEDEVTGPKVHVVVGDAKIRRFLNAKSDMPVSSILTFRMLTTNRTQHYFSIAHPAEDVYYYSDASRKVTDWDLVWGTVGASSVEFLTLFTQETL